jgi:hypothetical protein
VLAVIRSGSDTVKAEMGSGVSETVTPERIGARIAIVRGEKVLLDSDLAALYAVSTKRLNEQVRRNRKRFPLEYFH